MRKVRYSVAMSLDGYIAGPKGESDWIIMDPDVDFAAFFKSIDTVLIGRRTFEYALKQGGGGGDMPGMKAFVFSKTLRAADYPDVTMVSEDAGKAVAALRAQAGKDIWLMGGGALFRSLLDAGQMDSVEIAIMPLLLGSGTPFLPSPGSSAKLQLVNSKAYKSGIVSLQYTIRKS